MRAWHYCTVAFLLAIITPRPTASQPAPTPGEATFNIFIQSLPVGTERVTISQSDDGWTVSSTGRVSGALDLVIRRFEMRYDDAWNPIELTIDAVMSGEPYEMHTSFNGTSAASEILEGGESRTKTDPVSADTIVLPTNFFGAWEVLAARLSATSPGTAIPVYIAPHAEITIRLNRASDQRIATAGDAISARRHHVTILNPTNPFDAEVWADDSGRLLRISMPMVGLDVARTDITSVSARQQTIQNDRDEDVRVPASGFSLGATVTPPPDRTTERPRWPAVILVPGSGSVDRDEIVSGIPIYGQLAGRLSDAGFLVIRYDKRGVGQSGGRTEVATLDNYAEDVREVVAYIRDRDDIDDRRVAVIGHSEGGWIAMLAASRERRINTLVLMATPSTLGADLVLEQQRLALQRMSLSEQEQQAKIELQQRIHAAVMSDDGWDSIAPELRQQADTPWFKSYLMFDPARVLEDVRQPIIVVHGGLDRQMAPSHGVRLAELAQARDRRVTVELVQMKGLNHLLIPAVTGEVDEYETLQDREISAELISTLSERLHTLMPARR